MSEPSSTRVIVVAVVFSLVGAVAAIAVVQPSLLAPASGANAAPMPGVRDFQLSITGADIEMGGGAVWHAWTFNGTVPGPTLSATVGDILRVTVTNTLNITHSFHTHLSPYALESDGSQLNTITGIGGMAMIAPGASYTYEFVANVPGLFYYHCHAASGGKAIQQHIAQGLYGAIVVNTREDAAIQEEVVFMAERGFNTTGSAPFFIMNGHGIPGGERALEDIFHQGGAEAVVAEFGKTVPAIHAKVGVPLRINIVNIGDAIHSFHIHGMTAYSLVHDPGQPVPAQVVGLVPGEVDRIVVTPNQPGIWLFHCHVVSHADAGMIGVFVVDP